LRPRRRRLLITSRPAAVLMRLRNPCLFLRFLLLGWNVLFTISGSRARGPQPNRAPAGPRLRCGQGVV